MVLVIRWFIAGFASPGRPRDCAGDAAALEGAVWHDLDRFGPFWTVLDRFGPFLCSVLCSVSAYPDMPCRVTGDWCGCWLVLIGALPHFAPFLLFFSARLFLSRTFCNCSISLFLLSHTVFRPAPRRPRYARSSGILDLGLILIISHALLSSKFVTLHTRRVMCSCLVAVLIGCLSDADWRV